MTREQLIDEFVDRGELVAMASCAISNNCIEDVAFRSTSGRYFGFRRVDGNLKLTEVHSLDDQKEMST